MKPGTNVFDVTDPEFEREVVDRSESLPVIVELWAPWSPPWETLDPVLEKVVRAHQDELVLVRVNIDENPGIAELLGVQAVPSVKAIRNRSLVGEFSGTPSEQDVREFCFRLLPTEEDRLATEGRAAEESGDLERAERLYRDAAAVDARHPLARLGLGRLLARTDPEAALGEFDHVLPDTPERNEADQLAARLHVGRDEGGKRARLEERLSGNPDDLDARIELGKLFTAAGEYEAALDHLLEAVRRDRHYADDAARKAMLEVFETLGPEDPRTDAYRTKLSRILFS